MFLARTTPSAGAGVEIGPIVAAGPEHALRYQRDIGTETAASFRARLSPTSGCWLVLDDERIVHATWWTSAQAWTSEIGRHFCVPPRAAYLYESYTRPEQRGRGIYASALSAIVARLGERAIDTVWIGSGVNNAASLKAMERAGFQRRFTVTARRRLGRWQVDVPEEGRPLIRAVCREKMRASKA